MAAHGEPKADITLVTRAKNLLNDSSSWVRSHVTSQMKEKKIRVILGRTCEEVEKGRALFDDGSFLEFDLLMWATGPEPHPVVKTLGLTRGTSTSRSPHAH